MNYNDKKLNNYQFVSIVASVAGQPRYYFPDLPNLREVFTTNIVAYDNTVMQYNPDGLSLANSAANLCFLTLVVGNEEVISKIDLATLKPLYTGQTTARYNNPGGNFAIPPTVFDYSKSYIEVYNPGTIIANTCFCFGIYFDYKINK